VNAALTPALVAASGGSAMLAGILLHEHRGETAMRATRRRFRLRFPAELDPLRARAALDAISGLPSTLELVAELSASADGVSFALWVPGGAKASVTASLAGIVPGARLEEEPVELSDSATRCLRLFVPTPGVLATSGAQTSAHALLAGLTDLSPGEAAIIRWALRPGRPRGLPEEAAASAHQKEVSKAWRRKSAEGA
jgi:hypothetical protein